MQLNRLFAGILIAGIAVFGTACGSNEQSDNPKPSEMPNNRLGQSAKAVDEVVIGSDGALHCKEGLTALVLPPGDERDPFDDYSSIDMGDTYLDIRRHGKDGADLEVEVHGKPLNIRAAFVETHLSGDREEFQGSATGPGVTEVVDSEGFEDYVIVSRYFTANWNNHMQLGFSVFMEDFGHGQQYLDSATLCVQP